MVERAAERIDVGPVVDGLAAHLFGRDVVGGAPDFVGVSLHRRETEVHQLRVAFRIVEDVLGLDVAMDQPLLGGERQRFGQLPPEAHDLHGIHGGRILLHVLIERAAGAQLHRNVGHALFRTEGIDLRDVRVIEAGGGLRLALEAFDERRVVAQALEHHLDADRAVQHPVASQIDAAHATVAQLLFKQEMPELGGRLDHRFFVFFCHGLLPFASHPIPRLRPLQYTRFRIRLQCYLIVPQRGLTIGQNTPPAMPQRFRAGTGPQ